jgi:uncharacterized protein
MPQAWSIPHGGATISAREYDAADAKATLILAHGAGAGQAHPFMVKMASDLAARGVQVVTFNFPYIERGRHVPDPAPVLEAAYEAVVDAAAAKDRRPLFIGGKSMGGRIATQVAARSETRAIAGIVVLGYPLHPPGKPGTLRVQHLTTIRAPVLIVQGTRDPFGSPEELAPYFPAPRAAIQPVTGGDHSFKVPKSAGPQPAVHLAIVDAIVNWIERTRGTHA